MNILSSTLIFLSLFIHRLPEEIRLHKTIQYNKQKIDLIIDKPNLKILDVLIVFHGTVAKDSYVKTATNATLNNFKSILNNKDMMIISVAYPQENVILGNNIKLAEAAYLWVKNKAEKALDVKINKIFLAGHSQGGYLVSRLNTMYQTNGVIANAPGPLNLVFRCQLEESSKINSSSICNQLKEKYGTTIENPKAYEEISLLNFTKGFKSDILFVQGLNDTPIQLYAWKIFKQEVAKNSNPQISKFVEIPDEGHNSLFNSSVAKKEFIEFIENR